MAFAPDVLEQASTGQGIHDCLADNSVTSVYGAQKSVAAGSSAQTYTDVLGRLWQAAYAANDTKLSEKVLGTPGSVKQKLPFTLDSTYSYCYPEVDGLPKGCFTFADFQFNDDGLIRDFTIDEIPVSRLVMSTDWDDLDKDDLVMDAANVNLRFYSSGGILSPTLDTMYQSLWFYPENLAAGETIVFNHNDVIFQDRNNSSTPGTLVIPDKITQFGRSYAALSINTNGQGFVRITSATGKGYEEFSNVGDPENHSQKFWLSLQRSTI
ncbi:hypothetical protein [Pseudoclavibacter sp. CFCC 11306]|uniref:hypothetical protein n=1 Tax=Pseudoclavibacter sp. CFCC 11306 TaxID=1564493 RepID=UPI001301437D|nr:hypothetical protein [Pseudoclavibacter sp. CFCC 11306]KAB1658155.1 hypothetical protein F8O09_00530 [Pseudoclavibacter sp. CFCC 11306]